MKSISILSKLLTSIVYIFLGAIALSPMTDHSLPLSTGLFIAKQFIVTPQNSLMAGLYPELWTGELVDKFRHEKSWLSVVPRRDDLVKNNTIHLVDVGVDPTVLVNNTTYPINSAQRTDADIALSLDKFDTENTLITKDELYNLPYDKPGSVIRDHRGALEDKTAQKSYHSLAPAGGAGNPSLILTTGASDGRSIARKAITEADIINAKEFMDNLDVPMDGRTLVLSMEHYNDLLKLNQDFAKKYKDIETGKILPSWYGFQIFQYNRPAVYSLAGADYTKKAFGAASTPSTEYKGSIFFYAPRAIQTVGTAEMFFADAQNDPKYRRHEIGFRLYHLCLPKKNTGFGAIVGASTV